MAKDRPGAKWRNFVMDMVVITPTAMNAARTKENPSPNHGDTSGCQVQHTSITKEPVTMNRTNTCNDSITKPNIAQQPSHEDLWGKCHQNLHMQMPVIVSQSNMPNPHVCFPQVSLTALVSMLMQSPQNHPIHQNLPKNQARHISHLANTSHLLMMNQNPSTMNQNPSLKQARHTKHLASKETM